MLQQDIDVEQLNRLVDALKSLIRGFVFVQVHQARFIFTELH